MDSKEALEYLRLMFSDSTDKEYLESEVFAAAVNKGMEALEKQVFFENTVGAISDWFVDNKDCLLDTALETVRKENKKYSGRDYIDSVDLDDIAEEIVDEIQKGILNVLSTFKEN